MNGGGEPVPGPAGVGALERLRALLQEGGGLMATLVRTPTPAGTKAAQPSRPARAAARGPRAEGHRDEYELLVEAIYEGYLLHYGKPRVVSVPEADLGLLAGDQLYAIGLARLVALGDTPAVAELADTITLSALARAARKQELAAAVWDAGAHAVGWGSSEEHRRAKQLVLAEDPRALDAMLTSPGGASAPS